MQTSDSALPVTIEGMDQPAWSNSPAVESAPQDVWPDVNVELSPAEAGWSNTAAHKPTVDTETATAKRLGISLDTTAETKVVETAQAEDKSVTPAKKTTRARKA